MIKARYGLLYEKYSALKNPLERVSLPQKFCTRKWSNVLASSSSSLDSKRLGKFLPQFQQWKNMSLKETSSYCRNLVNIESTREELQIEVK